ncbi:hypothetical protein GC425_06995 [Corynebacterium sp. zg254]|uniref:Uncharacterized protein n=1 Tax=Corynebacterium zhongnanshanii TaxID=2768834 RepID=A0ABQ6VDU6_9CORY|nr:MULTISPECIES: hypothetical protein [Corynebacterium]KAB3520971.1 hypothetical protein F8377_07015 [Corynebacterium zhongnanshanii]MCR5914605.1 hypothetical protein [Corynebacterium sp. zg254]
MKKFATAKDTTAEAARVEAADQPGVEAAPEAFYPVETNLTRQGKAMTTTVAITAIIIFSGLALETASIIRNYQRDTH